jgi:CRP-like cAMP-binding protein
MPHTTTSRVTFRGSSLSTLTQNHLLAALPAAEIERLAPYLEPVPMPAGVAVYESGSALQHVYFPTTSIVSLCYVMGDGAPTEIAMVGNEGVLGVSLFMGGETTTSRAFVQHPGHAFRMPSRVMKQEFQRCGSLMHLILHYTQALITQMAQSAVCNRHHTTEQRLCRWLLRTRDRLATNEVFASQETIAHALGVRRESVTEAAGCLQRDGLIRYTRAHITLLDRPAVEERVCECYAVVKREFDRLLPYRVPGLPSSPTVGSHHIATKSSELTEH